MPTPPAKRFSFTSRSALNREEVERLYDFLQAQLDRINTQLANLSTSGSSSTDYSVSIAALERNLNLLSEDVAQLRTAVGGLPEQLEWRFEDNDNRLVVTTPSGERQLLLSIYP